MYLLLNVMCVHKIICLLYFSVFFLDACQFLFLIACIRIFACCSAGLLEQPYVLEEGQKREKKKVQRLEVTPASVNKRKRLSLEEGSGMKLGDIPRVEFQLQRTRSSDLKPLHSLLFDGFLTVSISLQLCCQLQIKITVMLYDLYQSINQLILFCNVA